MPNKMDKMPDKMDQYLTNVRLIFEFENKSGAKKKQEKQKGMPHNNR